MMQRGFEDGRATARCVACSSAEIQAGKQVCDLWMKSLGPPPSGTTLNLSKVGPRRKDECAAIIGLGEQQENIHAR